MSLSNKRMELLGSAPVPRALLAMGLPTMTGMLVNALYNLADAYFAGRLGKRQMGAIAVVYPLGQVVVGLGLLFGNGAASCISRLLGRGDWKSANRIASTAIYGSLLAGAAVIALALVFLRPILRLLGATEGILPYAATYAQIYIASCILNVFNVAMNNIAASEGAARTAMCALLAGAALNIALDPLFILVLDMGVAGAALATAISQAVSTLIYLRHILRGGSAFHFRIQDCSFARASLAEILKIGVPTLAFQLLTSLSISMTNHAAGAYGDAAIAGMGIATRLLSMVSLSVFGFIKGFQPIAGYSYGAQNYGRLREAIRTSVLWSTLFCAALGLGLALFSETIAGLFAREGGEMLRVGATALRAGGAGIALFGFYTVYSSLFLALGMGGRGFLLGACRQGICFVPAMLILPAIWGLNGVIRAQLVADVLSAIVTACMAASLHGNLPKR